MAAHGPAGRPAGTGSGPGCRVTSSQALRFCGPRRIAAPIAAQLRSTELLRSMLRRPATLRQNELAAEGSHRRLPAHGRRPPCDAAPACRRARYATHRWGVMPPPTPSSCESYLAKPCGACRVIGVSCAWRMRNDDRRLLAPHLNPTGRCAADAPLSQCGQAPIGTYRSECIPTHTLALLISNKGRYSA